MDPAMRKRFDGEWDWNGRPIKVVDGIVHDYIGSGQWAESKLSLGDISAPGGDLSHWDSDEQKAAAMQRMDARAKAGPRK